MIWHIRRDHLVSLDVSGELQISVIYEVLTVTDISSVANVNSSFPDKSWTCRARNEIDFATSFCCLRSSATSELEVSEDVCAVKPSNRLLVVANTDRAMFLVTCGMG